jgi:hypothetical protein
MSTENLNYIAQTVTSYKDATTLPWLNDDQVQDVKCTWYDSVVRIGALTDGSCLLHAISKGYNPEYQIETDHRGYIKKLRKELADYIARKDPDSKKKTYYESAGEGALSYLGDKYKSGNKEHVEDFSLKGIQNLLNSDEYLGEEVYALIGQILKINIYIMRCTTVDVYKHTSFIYAKKPQWSVVIHGDGIHYETLGIKTSKGIQTAFQASDPFLKAIDKNAPGYVGPELNIVPLKKNK